MDSDSAFRRRRLLLICALSMLLAIAAVVIAKVLLLLIALVTNLSYYGTWSFDDHGPWENQLGVWAIFIPTIGGIIVGLMARYGSAGIRGHGIPEAMEKILIDDSRIPRRLTLLKPLSAAVAIGTGGPFGAEGPIIATGGAVGSWIGQVLPVSSTERKILLASGAAAGMTAIFGTPVSGVLLAIELLLFEFRAKSFIPVALAAVMAGTLRYAFLSREPVFPMPPVMPAGMSAFGIYLVIAFIVGLMAVVATKAIYWIEDAFEKLPIHWMWWPALGGIAVGVIGLIEPRSLGVGYSNITLALAGSFTAGAALSLVFWKFLSWAIALGSGTSGGTLAPLLTLGGCSGLLMGRFFGGALPEAGIDPHVAALVGMAAMFSGSSRAVLTSAVFAFEATEQPLSLIPLLGACSVAYVVSILLMDNTIMTEKIVRRGIRVPHEYYPRN